MSNVLTAQTITVEQLKERKLLVHQLLVLKDKAAIYVHITGQTHLYIVTQRGLPDYWTFNESQAVAVYNSVK